MTSLNIYLGRSSQVKENCQSWRWLFNVTEPWLMGYDVDPNIVSFVLTPHERNIILAYRMHDEMQEAVDRLLGVESEKRDQLPG